ncbi:MAG TPA: FHA domain-containing protein [Candidatus Acidoferrum sp.]|nr:FHA domain-containing protein [Candidatus Acidoferrum sp.]
MSVKNALLLDGSFTNVSSGLALPRDRTITISIIAGPSKGLTHQLTKPKTSIGHVGGGADIEINDPQAARMHCVVGLTEDTVRLCDLDSANGTYVNDERIQAADLEHLSEFRVGSTWFIVSMSRKNSAQSESNDPD